MGEWVVMTIRMTIYISSVSYLRIYGLIYDPHNGLLPVGLIAQLLEHYTGIAEVRLRTPDQAFLAAAKGAQDHSFNNDYDDDVTMMMMMLLLLLFKLDHM